MAPLFRAADVAYTVQQLMDPALHSATGDAFRSGTGNVETKVISPTQIAITFPAQVAGLDRLFDQVAILSEHSPKKEMAVLGPFMVPIARVFCFVEAQSQLLEGGRPGARLPYLDRIRLEIQQNRDIEVVKFPPRRDRPDQFSGCRCSIEAVATGAPLGGGMPARRWISEMMWFNQAARFARSRRTSKKLVPVPADSDARCRQRSIARTSGAVSCIGGMHAPRKCPYRRPISFGSTRR